LPPHSEERNRAMADIVFVLIVLAFFALCLLYVRGCERILGKVEDTVESPTEVAR